MCHSNCLGKKLGKLHFERLKKLKCLAKILVYKKMR